jgi:hypothetical protein
MNAGDTAWVLVSTGLVMVMVPGLALFYGGLVSNRNVLVMLQQDIFRSGWSAFCGCWPDSALRSVPTLAAGQSGTWRRSACGTCPVGQPECTSSCPG